MMGAHCRIESKNFISDKYKSFSAAYNHKINTFSLFFCKKFTILAHFGSCYGKSQKNTTIYSDVDMVRFFALNS